LTCTAEISLSINDMLDQEGTLKRVVIVVFKCLACWGNITQRFNETTGKDEF
jgi:hypothetical protein